MPVENLYLQQHEQTGTKKQKTYKNFTLSDMTKNHQKTNSKSHNLKR